MRGIAAAGLILAAPPAAAAQQAEAPVAGPVLPRIVEDCPRSADEEEVVVCGRRGRSPYRLPETPDRFDPFGEEPSVSLERHRLYEVGEAGIGSCSPVGPGGVSGCQEKAIREGIYQRGGRKKGI